PAFEVEVDKSSRNYSALYTTCLKKAYADPPRAQTLQVGNIEVLPNRSLKKILPPLVETAAIKASATLFQKPDTIVESDSNIYLAEVRRTRAQEYLLPSVRSLREHAD